MSNSNCQTCHKKPNIWLLSLALLSVAVGASAFNDAHAQDANGLVRKHVIETQTGLNLGDDTSSIEVEVIEDGLVRLHYRPDHKITAHTLVMAPRPKLVTPEFVKRLHGNGTYTFATGRMTVTVSEAAPYSITVSDSHQQTLLRCENPLADARTSSISLTHSPKETLYGMRGLPIQDSGEQLARDNGKVIAAGMQGDSGAPFAFTHGWGVLIDSNGGEFITHYDHLQFQHSSRPDVEYFIAVGPPTESIAAVSRLVGPPPLPPKWTLGFINSQWGSTQKEVEGIVARYRQDRIPIDGFILDFDWKAWGEDNYGEWRWNSTSGKGSIAPDKFPDGASGAFATKLNNVGVKLGAILKPRILLNAPGNKNKLTLAAQYAQDHNLWFPGEQASDDYFTHRAARNLDFNKSATRAWFWNHLEPAFKTGMVAWWNDEADSATESASSNFQFLNMGRSLYEGQRAISGLRVWSLNRNFYLGASRYGYAGWSGDIPTGFESMAYQRRRMLAALNTGEFLWSMDTGGFAGHPTDENYARWMEFAAFVPIMRVHGDWNEKRQPWLYGPLAEDAARHALELRYTLLPYIYSYARGNTEGSVGLVRPLLWEFPDDKKACATFSEWMFGDALLVSPVVSQGATSQHVYLPAGDWFDYATGIHYAGLKDVDIPIDSRTWKDIPIFVRAGSIIATQALQQYVGQQPVTEITLDIFPTAKPASFVVYEDDGKTYSYERGIYMRQRIIAATRSHQTEITLDAATGSYVAPLKTYLLRIHAPAHEVRVGGKILDAVRSMNLTSSTPPLNWTTDRDKFGPSTQVRIPAGRMSSLSITLQ